MPLVRILLRAAVTVGAAWLLATYLPQYVVITGGLRGVIVVGLVLAFLNSSVRMLLDILTFPLRLFSRIVVIILVNAALLKLAEILVGLLSETVARFYVQGGWIGWVVTSVVFGLLSWLIRTLLKEDDGKRHAFVGRPTEIDVTP
jgi:uncharacterized membrane protein YvlD (DUF360 family)